jgi:hypothetical protein
MAPFKASFRQSRHSVSAGFPKLSIRTLNFPGPEIDQDSTPSPDDYKVHLAQGPGKNFYDIMRGHDMPKENRSLCLISR